MTIVEQPPYCDVAPRSLESVAVNLRCRSQANAARRRADVPRGPARPRVRRTALRRVLADRKALGSGYVCSLPKPLVVLQGFLELVFENDDPAGGFQGGAPVDHFSGPGGQTQL